MFLFSKRKWPDFDTHGLPEALDWTEKILSSKSIFFYDPDPKNEALDPKIEVSGPKIKNISNQKLGLAKQAGQTSQVEPTSQASHASRASQPSLSGQPI